MHKAQLDNLLKHARSGAFVMYLAVGLLLVIVLVVAGDDVAHHIDAIEAWVKKLGPWAGLGFIALFVLANSLLLPQTLLAVMAGALFGLQWGLVAMVASSLLAASLQYVLARRLLRPLIARALASRPSLRDIQKAVVHEEFKIQALLRLTPLSPAVTNYLLGAVGVRFSGFLLACLAQVPKILLAVYIGYAGKYAAHVAGRKSAGILPHDLLVFGGLAVTVLVMVLVAREARKAILQAVAASNANPPTSQKPPGQGDPA